MPICAVATCNHYSRNTKGSDVTYHRFPTKDKKLQTQWIKKCRRGDKFNLLHATVCSSHFTQDDYYRDLQHELLGLKTRTRGFLKPTAIPSLLLPGSSCSSTSSAANAAAAMTPNSAILGKGGRPKRMCTVTKNTKGCCRSILCQTASIQPESKQVMKPTRQKTVTKCTLAAKKCEINVAGARKSVAKSTSEEAASTTEVEVREQVPVPRIVIESSDDIEVNKEITLIKERDQSIDVHVLNDTFDKSDVTCQYMHGKTGQPSTDVHLGLSSATVYAKETSSVQKATCDASTMTTMYYEDESVRIFEQNEMLKKKIEQLQKLVKSAPELKVRKIDKFKKEIAMLQTQLTDARQNNIAIKEKLNETFTAAQIQCIVQGKKKTWWKDEDICNAITLRSLSKESYDYLRKQMKVPLPGITTLRRWTNAHLSKQLTGDAGETVPVKGQNEGNNEDIEWENEEEEEEGECENACK